MNLPIIPGTLDNPTCYSASPQEFYNEMFQKGVAVLTGSLTGVILSDTEPAATDRDKVWARTSGGAPVFPFMWIFFGGLWVAKHPVPAGTLWALPYTGTTASIATLDGGAVGAVSDNSGPFWEEVVSLQARMPIGAGTLASGTVLAVGDTGGEEKHVLIENELPEHTHLLVANQNVDVGAVTANQRMAQSGGTGTDEYGLTGSDLDATIALSSPVGNDEGHNNLSPYLVLTFLRRTARKYCTVPIA